MCGKVNRGARQDEEDMRQIWSYVHKRTATNCGTCHCVPSHSSTITTHHLHYLPNLGPYNFDIQV